MNKPKKKKRSNKTPVPGIPSVDYYAPTKKEIEEKDELIYQRYLAQRNEQELNYKNFQEQELKNYLNQRRESIPVTTTVSRTTTVPRSTTTPGPRSTTTPDKATKDTKVPTKKDNQYHAESTFFGITLSDTWWIVIVLIIVIVVGLIIILIHDMYVSNRETNKIRKIIGDSPNQTWDDVIKKIPSIPDLSDTDKREYINMIKYQKGLKILTNKNNKLCVNKNKWRESLKMPCNQGSNDKCWIYLMESDINNLIKVVGECDTSIPDVSKTFNPLAMVKQRTQTEPIAKGKPKGKPIGKSKGKSKGKPKGKSKGKPKGKPRRRSTSRVR